MDWILYADLRVDPICRSLTEVDSLGAPLLIDSHGAPVAEAVWALYDEVLALTGPVATLLERDNDLPAFSVLLVEAQQAGRRLDACRNMALEAA